MEETLIAQAAPQPELINNPGLSFLASLGSTKDMSKHNTDMFSTILTSLVESNDSSASSEFALSENEAGTADSSSDDKQDAFSDDFTASSDEGDDYAQEEIAYEDVQEVSDYQDNSSSSETENSDVEADVAGTETKKTEEAKDSQDSKSEESAESEKSEKAQNSKDNAEDSDAQNSDTKTKITKTEVSAEAKVAVKDLVAADNSENISEVKKTVEAEAGKGIVSGELNDETKAKAVTGVDATKEIKQAQVENKVVSGDAKITVEGENLKDEQISDAEVLKLAAKVKETGKKVVSAENTNKSVAKEGNENSDIPKEVVAENIKAQKNDTNEQLLAGNKVKVVESKDNTGNVVDAGAKESFDPNAEEKETVNVKAQGKTRQALAGEGKEFSKADTAKNTEQQLGSDQIQAEASTKVKVKADVFSANAWNEAGKSSEIQNAGEAKTVDVLAGSKNVTGALGAGKTASADAKGAASTSQTSYSSQVSESKIIDQILTKAKLTIKQNSKEMNLRLDPPDLGSVKMKLTLSNDNVLTAKIEVNNSAVRASVNNNINSLRESLSSEGIKIDKFDVFVKDENSENQQNGQQNQNKSAGSAGSFYSDEETIDINEIKEEVLNELEVEKGKVNFLA